MVEQQKTFGEVVGMPPLVAVEPDLDAPILCEDGTVCTLREAELDYNGGVHSTDEDRHESDVTIVSEFLDGVAEWVCEYTRENDDYTSGYDHMVSEDSHSWPDRVGEWFQDNHEDWSGHSKFDDCKDQLIDSICEELDGHWDCNVEFSGDEYSRYSGDGCCLASFEIGECEEQLSIADHPILEHFHDKGTLDDILDDVNCDLYISRSAPRVKNEKTGHYEYVGRESYNSNGSDYPDVMGYISPGGQWHWVVHEDKMAELLTTAIIGLCRKPAG